MKKSRLLGAVCAVLCTLITVSANATLVSRLGGAAAYDDVLNITWLTDAGLSGPGNWDNRIGWADGLNDANYLGFDGWRLASVSVAAGLPTGSTDNGSLIYCEVATEMACRDNELGYMFYYNMGGSAGEDKTGNQTVNGVLLTDVQSIYTSGTEVDRTETDYFFYDGGVDFLESKDTFSELSYGWAVRAGDVPVPPALWLFGSGLLGLIGVARCKK